MATDTPSLTDLLSLPAGRELDRAVWVYALEREDAWLESLPPIHVSPKLSTSIAASWPLMPIVWRRWPDATISQTAERRSLEMYWDYDHMGPQQFLIADTIELLLCRAALRAKLERGMKTNDTLGAGDDASGQR